MSRTELSARRFEPCTSTSNFPWPPKAAWLPSSNPAAAFFSSDERRDRGAFSEKAQSEQATVYNGFWVSELSLGLRLF
jgi:hypothetical protein